MSKYQLNKALRCLTTVVDERLSALYDSDRSAFASSFELTSDEHRALAEEDIVALYKFGVQPFLLLQYAQRVWKIPFTDTRAFLEVQKRYVALIAPYGNPDMST